MQATDGVGSPVWVRDRLLALPAGDSWADSDASRELIAWFYVVAGRRARKAGLWPANRAEIAQDAMPRIVSALNRSRARIAEADNPAAVLERVTARAVSAAAHRARMSGLGGVPPNGRHWRERYPRSIGGEVGWRLLEAIPQAVDSPAREVEAAAARVADWVTGTLQISLTSDAVHAVTYVLDRLVAGASRGALVRGGYIGLSADPAMGHLGFDPATSRKFARWLLGRTDPGHEVAAVLDAALFGAEASANALAGWQRTATKVGFARENTEAAISAFPTRPANPSRRIA